MGGADDRGAGIVWLEDGREVAFEPAGARRPWLEESSDWGDAPAAPEGDKRPDEEPPELVWL